MNAKNSKKCHLCVQSGVETPATRESEYKLQVFGNANPVVVYACDECYSQLPATDAEAEALLGAPMRGQDHLAKNDFEPIKPLGRPRMGPERRVKTDTTVSAATMARIEAERKPGESRGQVIDRAVKALAEKGEKT